MRTRRRELIAQATQGESWYITDGLVFHLDGIKNTANGHSTTTNTWEDLTDNVILTSSNGSVIVRDTYYEFDGNYHLNFAELYDMDCGTIEAVLSYGSDCPTDAVIARIYRTISGTPATIYKTIACDGGILQLCADETHPYLTHTRIDDNLPHTYCSIGYIDGQAVTSSGTPTGWRSDLAGIAGRSNGTYRYVGKIYAIRVYNRELTTQEILHNQNLDIERFGIQTQGE